MVQIAAWKELAREFYGEQAGVAELVDARDLKSLGP